MEPGVHSRGDGYGEVDDYTSTREKPDGKGTRFQPVAQGPRLAPGERGHTKAGLHLSREPGCEASPGDALC